MEQARLPAWAARWLEGLEIDPPHREKRAHCEACVMCSPEDWTARHTQVRFKPDVRCCSYAPVLANFLVGAALADEGGTDAGARERLRQIASGPEGLPLGVIPSMHLDGTYRRAMLEGGFGRDEGIRCPYFVMADRSCGIWQHRNAVCLSWHCRHERGMVGQGYWTAVRLYLDRVSTWLSREALRAVAPGVAEDSWEAWGAPQLELYRAAAEWFEQQDPVALRPDAPEEVLQAADMLRMAGRMHAGRGMPTHAVVREVQAIEMLGEHIRLDGYTTMDAVVIPVAVYKQLALFDGRAIAEVREEYELRGVELTDEVIQRLVDFDVIR